MTATTKSQPHPNKNTTASEQGLSDLANKQFADLNELLNGGHQQDQQQPREENSLFPLNSAASTLQNNQNHYEPSFSSLESLSRPETAPSNLITAHEESSLKRSTATAGFDDEFGDGFDDDEETALGPSGAKKASGRRKIKIEYIEDKSRRHITFSKRKAGIMKKAYELSTLTGTQILLLVASETGHIYTFATPKLQPLITKPEGKNMIQACLNSTVSDSGGIGSGPRSGTPVNYSERFPSSVPPPQPLSSMSLRNNDGGSPPLPGSLPSASIQQAQQQAHYQQTHHQQSNQEMNQQHQDIESSLSSYNNNNNNQHQQQIQYNQANNRGYTTSSYSTAGLPLSPRSQVYRNIYSHHPQQHNSNMPYSMGGYNFSQNHRLNSIIRTKSPTHLQNENDFNFDPHQSSSHHR